MRGALLIAIGVLILGGSARAEETLPEAVNTAPHIVSKIKIDQKLGDTLPLELAFKNEKGETVQLKEFFGTKPAVLALVYYECPSLCTMVLNGLFRSLQEVKLERGTEFSVVVVSIDPRETPSLAEKKRKKYTTTYLHSDNESGLHFLTGDQAAITALTKAVGFGYEWDPKLKVFAHPGAITLLTPQAKISSYLFGVDFAERDLRLGLVEASGNKIGRPLDHFLLYCYKYDPLAGKYGLVVMNMLRMGGIITLLLLGGLVGWLIHGQKKRDGYRIEAP